MTRHTIAAATSILLTALTGCAKTDSSAPATSAASEQQTPVGVSTARAPDLSVKDVASTEGPDSSAPAPASDAGNEKGPVVTWKNVGISTPESVLYDDVADLYLVSNINGNPTDRDNNGFISRLTPEGTVETLKWIEGGKNKVTLNAPKGSAFFGDRLYVADIDTVRIFDRKTGAPAGDVKVPGATFLNDITATSSGVIVSDSGKKATAKGFENTGTDAIYHIDKNKKLTTVAKTTDLGAPNGVLRKGDKTWVVTFSGELYSLDDKGKKADVQKLPKGSLDGIVALPNGDFLISSWDASAIYRGAPGSEFKTVIENVNSPADIGYDTKRNRVLVPIFTGNEVRAFEVR
ncbi:MAG: hypothetical protein FWD69_20015 [Polyangiaceae bacterium]|nr:hypothetical protein [Polyangiaceae bacterium]